MVSSQTFGDRVKTARERLGWTQEDYAREASVSTQTIRRYEAREHAPTGNRTKGTLSCVASAANVSTSWLKTGQGEMLSSGQDEKLLGNDGDIPGAPTETNISGHSSTDRIHSLFSEDLTLKIFTDVRASAGDGRVVYQEDARHVSHLPRGFITQIIGFVPPREIGVMFVEGDSMAPTLEQDELLIWEPAEEVRAGGVYVMLLDGGLIVKRVDPIPGGGYDLISDNHARGYPKRSIVPNEDRSGLVLQQTGSAVDLCVVGKVLWPRKDTDRLHIQQVTQIIRGLSGGDGARGEVQDVRPSL